MKPKILDPYPVLFRSEKIVSPEPFSSSDQGLHLSALELVVVLESLERQEFHAETLQGIAERPWLTDTRERDRTFPL